VQKYNKYLGIYSSLEYLHVATFLSQISSERKNYFILSADIASILNRK